MLSVARVASKTLLENSRQFSSLTLKSGYNPMLATALAQKYDVRLKSDGECDNSVLVCLTLHICQVSRGLSLVSISALPTPVLPLWRVKLPKLSRTPRELAPRHQSSPSPRRGRGWWGCQPRDRLSPTAPTPSTPPRDSSAGGLTTQKFRRK